MKAKILIVSLCLLIVAACSKDKYNTTPTLTFKSVNGTEFPYNSTLVFKFQVTDKEGDIQDSMWYEKISFTCGEDGHAFSGNPVPDFASRKDLKADVDITLPAFSGLSRCTNRDDSCYFRFWIHDRAGHTSDTVTSPTIKLLKD